MRFQDKTRLLLKLNKDAYEEHKRKDRKRRRLAKHRQIVVIYHSHLDQEPSQTTSFRNSDVTSRIIKNVEKSLPRIPRKKKEVIKSLASKFNMKVKLGQKSVEREMY